MNDSLYHIYRNNFYNNNTKVLLFIKTFAEFP